MLERHHTSTTKTQVIYGNSHVVHKLHHTHMLYIYIYKKFYKDVPLVEFVYLVVVVVYIYIYIYMHAS